MVTLADTFKKVGAKGEEYVNWLSSQGDQIVFLDKAQSGRTTLEDIVDSLDEYKRLFIAGVASPGEIITLSRAYPENLEYVDASDAFMGDDDDDDAAPMIVGGPASVELIDREGHLITTDALKKAFKRFMNNFRTRNVMVMHSDVQVGHALPAYISKAGNIFKSGVDDKGLFFIAELRGDTRISNRVKDQIKKGGMKSYSIAGSATKSKDIKKSDGTSVLQVDDLELAEVTICEKGVNQASHFELLKGDKAEGSCADGSCLTKSHDSIPEPEVIIINKEDVPSYTDLFLKWNQWMTKQDPPKFNWRGDVEPRTPTSKRSRPVDAFGNPPDTKPREDDWIKPARPYLGHRWRKDDIDALEGYTYNVEEPLEEDPEEKGWFKRNIFDPSIQTDRSGNPLATYDDPYAPAYPLLPSYERGKLASKVGEVLSPEERKKQAVLRRQAESAEVPVKTGGWHEPSESLLDRRGKKQEDRKRLRENIPIEHPIFPFDREFGYQGKEVKAAVTKEFLRKHDKDFPHSHYTDNKGKDQVYDLTGSVNDPKRESRLPGSATEYGTAGSSILGASQAYRQGYKRMDDLRDVVSQVRSANVGRDSTGWGDTLDKRDEANVLYALENIPISRRAGKSLDVAGAFGQPSYGTDRLKTYLGRMPESSFEQDPDVPTMERHKGPTPYKTKWKKDFGFEEAYKGTPGLQASVLKQFLNKLEEL